MKTVELPKIHPLSQSLILPKGYHSQLNPLTTAKTLHKVKAFIEKLLEEDFEFTQGKRPTICPAEFGYQ